MRNHYSLLYVTVCNGISSNMDYYPLNPDLNQHLLLSRIYEIGNVYFLLNEHLC